jgi:hypothetical protein
VTEKERSREQRYLQAILFSIITSFTCTEEIPYEHSVVRKRLRKVIDDLIRVGCKFVYHETVDGEIVKIFQKNEGF